MLLVIEIGDDDMNFRIISPTLISMLVQISLRRLKAFILQRNKYDYLMPILILVYSIVFSYFTCR